MLSLAVTGVITIGSASAANTSAAFDGGADTTLTLERFGDPGQASIQTTGGNGGGYLQLTDKVNGQNNWASFDRTHTGTAPQSTFAFQFKIEGPNSADGISFSYANTAAYGTSGGLGAPKFTPEDPQAAGILGFGFDTWSNNGGTGGPDDPAQAQSSDYSEISLFWDNSLVARIDDTRKSHGLTLDDGAWHDVYGTVDFAGAKVSLTVDGKVIFDGQTVAGLTPFESRILFAARTGGENELAGIDNLNVTYVPEPSVMALGALGLGMLVLRKRKS